MNRPTRRRQRRAAGTSSVPRLPWRTVCNRLRPIEVLSDDQVEAIHHASLQVLAELGLRITDPEARRVLREAGAEVDEENEDVRFPPSMVEEHIAHVPAQFTLRARNPKKSLTIGGAHITFNAVGGPGFVSDLDKGRRAGTYAELCDFKRVMQSFDIIHYGGGGFEPLDLPPQSRHLDIVYAQATLTDKVWPTSLLGRRRARDGLAMACIVHGISRDELVEQPVVFGNINTNSPRLLDGPMAQGLMELARHGQPVVVTPFTLCGAMAPVTVVGALTQQNAEALAGMTLTQAIRPGTPVVYGGFTSNVDMRSGAPAFGTPEQTQATHATGQLVRRYRVPFRSSNTNASTSVDAQAAYESEMSLWGAVMAHANMIFHGAGWLEGGLVASFEKLVIDAEMLQMMAEYLRPLVVDDDTLALSAMREVAPGGHYFGADHTMQRYDKAFYTPIVSDWSNYENWLDNGGLDAQKRANAIWKRLLEEYEQPPLDPAVDEALKEYVAKRKVEIGDSDAIDR